MILPIFGNATVDIGLSESLRQALEAQGWQAEETGDGSLIYRKSSGSVKQDQEQPVIKTLGGEDLNRALRDRGWQMEWSPAGSLILKPQKSSQSQADESVKEIAPVSDRSAVQRQDQPGLEYWRIERQDDGSFHFYPLAPEVGAANRSTQLPFPGHCEGVEVQRTAVSLPVDGWREAQTVAQGWLLDAGLADTQVGKIRKVLGIYLISLVDRSPPFHLQHQLAIRASDGRVILLE